ncbi:MAG: hypothetical protein KGO49_06955 [Gammaproteobacteria bacterium]|nr:hypothetical protein [Gammaproteobacteria bacterium]
MKIDMENLSDEQTKIRNNIYLKSSIWSGLIVFVISIFVYFYFKNEYPIICYVLSILSFLILFPVVFMVIKTAEFHGVYCKNCNSPFSIALQDVDESLICSVPRQRSRVVGKSISGSNEGLNRVIHESWIEEKYEVLKTYTCICCSNSYIKKSNKTRETNKTSDEYYD